MILKGIGMNSLHLEIEILAEDISITEDTLSVQLSDGRSLTVPLAWFPRLLHADKKEKENYRLIGKGTGLHWPDLDEDISIEGLILGRRSNESPASLERWLSKRKKQQ